MSEDMWTHLALFKAIRSHDAAAWSVALRVAGAANARDAMGRSVLHRIALSTDAPVLWMREAVEAGAQVDALDHAGWTPLHWACERGRSDAVGVLMEMGADAGAVAPAPKYKAASGLTPIQLASVAGKVEVFKALSEKLKDGAPCAARAGRPVFLATVWGRDDLVEHIAKSGGSLALSRFKGMRDEPPLLSAAILNKKKSTFEKLAGLGAPLEETEIFRELARPMHRAAASPDPSFLSLLIELGAEVDSKLDSKWTPLHLAAERDLGLNAKILLKAGADPRLETSHGRSAAQVAAYHGSMSVLFELMGRDPELATERGRNGQCAMDLLSPELKADAESMLLGLVAQVKRPASLESKRWL